MANVEEGTSAAAAADSGNLWGSQSQGKVTRRRVLAAGGVLGAAALGLGLYFGLKKDDQQTRSTIISGQADPNAAGCFADTAGERVMTAQWTNGGMTPEMCNTYCGDLGYFYYSVQWGIECWCAAADVALDQHGTGLCDFACGGDDGQICGGYYAFTAYEVGTTASTPTPTPSTTSDCSGGAATIRFTDDIAYFEGGGCGTLTQMYEAQTGEGPLYVLNDSDEVVGGTPTGRWLLDRNVRVVGGSTLEVHGAPAGGDADVLRIKSTSSEYYELRGYGGNLSFKNTKVTSWDTSAGAEREYKDNEGRSFINCVTQFDDSDKWTCEGASSEEHGECRMDIIESTMGNMGWFDAESYGLTWKVRGMCKEIDSSTGRPVNHEIFETHNVYGDIIDSDIYGMYYGHYSYGHEGGVWTNNKMHDNILYGFDPHDDSDNLEISFNEVYNNGNHGIIASKRCNNVKIHDNEVYNGGENAAGIFLHRSSDDAEVYNNYVHDMQDAGMALMESYNADIHDNVFENCKYGIRLSLGSGDNQIYDNSFSGFSQYGLYTYEGSDAPDVPDNNGHPKNNVFTSNIIADVDIGVHIKEGEDNEFIGNTFSGVSTFEFEDSTGTVWTGNDVGGACLDGSTDFAEGSITSC